VSIPQKRPYGVAENEKQAQKNQVNQRRAVWLPLARLSDLFTDSIARSAKRRYLSYSEGNF